MPLVHAANKITNRLDLKVRLLDAVQAIVAKSLPQTRNGALGGRGSRTFAPTVGQRAHASIPSELTAERTLSSRPSSSSTSVSIFPQKRARRSRCPSARSIGTSTSLRRSTGHTRIRPIRLGPIRLRPMADLGQFDLGQFDLGQFDLGLLAQIVVCVFAVCVSAVFAVNPQRPKP